MKINHASLSNKTVVYGNNLAHGRLKGNLRQQDCEVQKNKENYRPAERASLSGSERLTGSCSDISFTGDPKLITKITKQMLQEGESIHIPSITNKMGRANWFAKLIDKADANETIFEAVSALIVAGIMKPICVLIMPGAEMEDKQMSATKNAVSAFLGFGLSNLILSPFSKGVNKIIDSIDGKNPTQYIKNKNFIKDLQLEELIEYKPGKFTKSTMLDAFKTTYKKIPDLAVSPMKAALTIALTPYILKFLFGKDKKKSDEKPKNIDQTASLQIMNSIKEGAAENKNAPKIAFKGENSYTSSPFANNTANSAPAPATFTDNSSGSVSFTGNINTANNAALASAPVNAAPPLSAVTFTGNAADIATDAAKAAKKSNILTKPFRKIGQAHKACTNFFGEQLAKLIGKIAPTKIGQMPIKATSHFDKPTARWSDLVSFIITYFYVSNTHKSDKIDEERKMPLMVNNVALTAASSTAAFLIDKYTDKPMQNLLRSYIKNRGDELHKASKTNIIKVLENALEKGKDQFELDKLKRHADELLDGTEIKGALLKTINELKENETVQRAIKEKIIENDDIAKMAAAGLEKQAKSIYGKIAKAKSLIVFTLTVRFLVTVVMTGPIGRLVAFINKKLGRDEKGRKIEDTKPNTDFGMKDYISSIKK